MVDFVVTAHHLAARAAALTPLLLLFVAPLPRDVSGQRLSQGASDWYMRFHDFDMVKRHFDHPITTSFHVSTVIKHRYAITEVQTTISNPAKVKQIFNFGFAMPRQAFISNVTLQRRNQTIQSQVNESDWYMDHSAKRNGGPGKDKDHNNHNNHPMFNKDKLDVISNDHADFKQFILPIHLAPKDEVTLTLIYEMLLVRKQDQYVHSVSISPGEIVKDFQIRLTIADSNPLSNVNISAPVIGEITNDSVKIDGQENIVTILFSMSEVEQFHYFGSHGFTGDFNGEFDIDLTDDEVDLIVQDQHFLHFYDIPEKMKSIPKHVIFLMDNSCLLYTSPSPRD